jgi:(2R)-3-sulfolactate dehydrogenase (NADP+)
VVGKLFLEQIPWLAAFPIQNDDPLVIDMSLSAVARGKLLVAG